MTQRTTNWGRWGKEDQRGALNLNDPRSVLQAAGLVKQGRLYNLAIPIEPIGVPCPERGTPVVHLMAQDGGDFAAGVKAPDNVQSSRDFVFMPTHYGTHIDALSHVWHDGRMYNDFSGNTVTSAGAAKCGIETSGPIATRGVMLDVLSFKGTDALPPTYIITPDDLEGCARRQGVSVRAGDTLLIRTGRLCQYRGDRADFYAREPGPGAAAAAWMAEKDICAAGADNAALEAVPWDGADRGLRWPVHVELLRNRGIFILEFLDLEELARDGVSEFLFVAAPLRIVGAVGSPLTPIAIA